MIDLGKWVNEEYRIPAEELDEEELGDRPSDGRSKPDEDMRH
jgi:endogenous inhibitor of DNA gyrase (YacG/DUF329 family)